MTYRLVPPKTWGRLQKVLLVVTVFVGTGILLAPPDRDSRLTAIENAMNVDLWGYAMVGAAITALCMEFYMDRRKNDRFINLVGYCHIICCSLMVGFAMSATAGVLTRTWWNVGAPTIALFLAYLHAIYVRRRPTNLDRTHQAVVEQAAYEAIKHVEEDDADS